MKVRTIQDPLSNFLPKVVDPGRLRRTDSHGFRKEVLLRVGFASLTV